MRILSGTTDQYVYFVAVDATDLKTREVGLVTGGFTVYRSRNGATAVLMTHVITETDATNMPGVYHLLLDEDMTIGAGNISEDMVFHITHSGMNPVSLGIELYDFNNLSSADVLTTQLTEAYAADNVAPTLAEAIFMIQQSVGEFAITTGGGTGTLTVKKLDGSTTAATFTLDSDTNPTSTTRAT